MAAGHSDAATLETVMGRIAVVGAEGPVSDVDAAVLDAAWQVGTLVTNDLALGRRARSLGVAWLRTADLVVWGVRAGTMTVTQGRRAVDALGAAGRITPELAHDYLTDLT
jgi:hypothetical protein